MWKVSWFYGKVHNSLVVPLYYVGSAHTEAATHTLYVYYCSLFAFIVC